MPTLPQDSDFSNNSVEGSSPVLTGSIFGNYRLGRVLGEGGMGMVYEALDLKLDRKVALKVMHDHIARRTGTKERFLREARTAAKVHNDHIITIHYVDEVRGLPFIVMELLHGEPLNKMLERQPIPALGFTLKVGLQVAEGLEAAQAEGLIHRDIKPANIFLEARKDNTFQRCKILDFGLARAALGDDLSQSTTVTGTPWYMSPEQWKGKGVDHRSDLFSLGAMLYQMCTGKLPFEGDTGPSIMYSVLMTDPEPIQKVNPRIPVPLAQLITRLLAKDPTNRPQTATEVAKLLRELSSDRKRVETPTPVMSDLDLLDALPITDATQRVTNTPILAPQQLGSGSNTQQGQSTQGTGTSSGQNRLLIIGLITALLTSIALLIWLISQQGDTRSTEVAKNDTPKEKEKEKEKEQTKIETGVPVNKDTNKEEKKKEPIVKKRPVPLDCSSRLGADEQTVKASQKAWADHLGLPVETQIDLGNNIRIDLILIPPGTFVMGSSTEEEGRSDIEGPAEKVTITKAFYLSKYEISQQEYKAIMQIDPSFFSASGLGKEIVRDMNTSRFPVESVSWFDAKQFCDKVQARGLPKGAVRVRLPTEAEWEYACRAGTRSIFHFGSLLNGTQANCAGNQPYGTVTKGDSWDRPTPQGTFKGYGNFFGLFDMHGNVWEWCEDTFDPQAYIQDGKDRWIDQANAVYRVLRGGAWSSRAAGCRSAHRDKSLATDRHEDIGFRIVLNLQYDQAP